MIKNDPIMVYVFIFFISSIVFSGESQAGSEWEVIPVASEVVVTGSDGNPRTVHPSCSFDYLTNPEGGPPIDNSFRFYF